MRDRRVERGWTLDELAERSGVSRRMLVNVEQVGSNPSIATLLRLSHALGVGLPALVDVERPGALRVIGAGQAPVLWRGPSGGQALLVAGTEPPDVVELWDWTLEPGEAHRSEAHASGTRELLLVLTGQVELTVGQQTQLLTVGESARFAVRVLPAAVLCVSTGVPALRDLLAYPDCRLPVAARLPDQPQAQLVG